MSAPLSNHISILITRATVGVERTGFGVPMMVSYNAAWAERYREYADIDEVAEDFPSETGPEQVLATAYFAQEPKPEKLIIGRGANKPTMVLTASLVAPVIGTPYKLTAKGDGVTPTDIVVTPLADITLVPTHATDLFTLVGHGMSTGDGPYRLTTSAADLPLNLLVDTDYWIIALDADTFQLATSYANALAGTEVTFDDNGTGTHTLQRDANDVMVSQIVDRLNSVVGKNFTAARVNGAGDTDTFTVTADAAGEWFSIKCDFNTITSYLSHADPGIAADLTAIEAENSSWYCLLTNYNSNALVIPADAWVAARKKIYIFDTPNSVCVTGAVGGGGQDTLDNLKTLARPRTMGSFHNSPADMFSAAWVGKCLPLDPGTETWKWKQLTGPAVVDLTSTQRTNLRNKFGNSYESVAGEAITFEGQAFDEDFIDIQRSLDWLEDDMAKRILEALLANIKIPYTNAGVSIIKGKMLATLKEGVDREMLSDDPKPAVTAPRVANVSAADKAARLLPDMKFSATMAGAVHKVNVRGTVSL